MKKIVNHPAFILITGICSIVGLIVSLFQSIPNYVKYIIIAILIIGSLILLIYTINRFLSVKKYEKQLNDLFQETLDEAIKSVQLLTHNYTVAFLDANNSYDARSFKDKVVILCQAIINTISKLWGVEVNLCIKEIVIDELLSININNASTRTFIRCGNDSIRRAVNDSICQKVKDNSSFSELLNDPQILVWANKDLKKYAETCATKAEPYLNPNKKFLTYYNATIVAPIKCDLEFVDSKIKQQNIITHNNGWNNIGFLCIDFKNKETLSDKEFDTLSLFVMVCSELLYPIFENKVIAELDEVQNGTN